MFPDGPRVFRGTEGSAHKTHDFEDIRVSRLIDESTRRALTADGARSDRVASR